MEELSETIDVITSKFKKNKEFFFTGRGFITFRNYKFAYIFKLINDKMLQKDYIPLNEETKKDISKRKFQSVVKSLMVNKEMRNDFKELDS